LVLYFLYESTTNLLRIEYDTTTNRIRYHYKSISSTSAEDDSDDDGAYQLPLATLCLSSELLLDLSSTVPGLLLSESSGGARTGSVSLVEQGGPSCL
jgi:hypothetical protein